MKKFLIIFSLVMTGVLLVSCNNQNSNESGRGKGIGRGNRGDISDIVRLKDREGQNGIQGNFYSGARMGTGRLERFGTGNLENILSKLNEEDKQKFNTAMEARKKADETIREIQNKYPDVFSGSLMRGGARN